MNQKDAVSCSATICFRNDAMANVLRRVRATSFPSGQIVVQDVKRHTTRDDPSRLVRSSVIAVTIVNYTGHDGVGSIKDFLIAIRDIFNSVDEGSSQILTVHDKVLHRPCVRRIRRTFQRVTIAVGVARPDISISPQQLLQDLLPVILHCTGITSHRSTVGINIGVAARVAQNHHRGLMRTWATSCARGAARMRSLGWEALEVHSSSPPRDHRSGGLRIHERRPRR